MEVRVGHLLLATFFCVLGSGSCNVLSDSFLRLCNSTITLDEDLQGAVVDLNNMVHQRIYCSITIVTTMETGVRIRLIDGHVKYDEWDNCEDYLQLPNETVTLCNHYQHTIMMYTTPLTITLSISNFRKVPISLLFSVYTEATNIACPPDYAKCSQDICVPRSIYCYQAQDFCNVGTRCQDMPTHRGGVSFTTVIFPVVSCTVLVFALYYFFCVRCLKFHEKIKSKCCPSSASPPGTLRAVDVYVVRTSEDDDGTDAGPVDSRMFDPPPDYNSLGQIHTGSCHAYENKVDVSDELPPDYQAVMLNTAQYNVAMHIYDGHHQHHNRHSPPPPLPPSPPPPLPPSPPPPPYHHHHHDRQL